MSVSFRVPPGNRVGDKCLISASSTTKGLNESHYIRATRAKLSAICNMYGVWIAAGLEGNGQRDGALEGVL